MESYCINTYHNPQMIADDAPLSGISTEKYQFHGVRIRRKSTAEIMKKKVPKWFQNQVSYGIHYRLILFFLFRPLFLISRTK